MKRNISYLIMIMIALLLTACGKKEVPYVAPLIHFDETVAIKTFWTTMVGRSSPEEHFKPVPTLQAGQLYVVSRTGQISVVNTQTGKRVQQIRVKEAVSSGVGVGGNLLYMGTPRGEVIAVNRQNGNIVWRAPVSNEVLSTPNVVDNTVLVKTTDDHVYAFDGHNGRELWKYRQPVAGMTLRGGGAPPRVAGNMVVAGFSDGSVNAFNRQNGSMMWSDIVARPRGASVVEQMAAIDNALAIADGVVYVGTYQGVVVAIGLHSGEMLWEQKISSHASFAFDARHIYVTDVKGHLWALNKRTGAMVWRQENLTGRGITGPAVLGDIIVVGDQQGFIHWMTTRTGQFVARTRPDPSPIATDPITDGRSVYIYTSAGRLVKYGR